MAVWTNLSHSKIVIDMNFPSIDIQGSILSTDLLAKIRSEQATFLYQEE